MDRRLTRKRVHAILEGDDPYLGRRVAFFLQGVILVSVSAVALETLPDLSPTARGVLRVIELTTVAIFAAEYAVRVWASPSPPRYIFSFFGFIDLAAILPTLLVFLGVDLRVLVGLRIMRVLLLFKLIRYTRAVRRLSKALQRVTPELLVFAGMAGAMLYLCATAIYLFEHKAQPEAFASVFHALWWAVVTFTTVGYGDVVPVTTGGRIFTTLILVLALGIVAVPTGLIASALASEHPLEPDADETESNEAQRELPLPFGPPQD